MILSQEKSHMRLTMLFATVWLASLAGVPINSFSGSPSGSSSAAQNARRVTIPAGTRILVRTNDAIDSTRSRPGFRFTAVLETHLQLDNVTVAPRGTTVHGQLMDARAAGRMSGGANVTLELTDIIINGVANPIMTSSFEMRSQGQGGDTTRRAVRGAGLGALVGGIAGGGRGAGIGAAAGAGTGTALSAARGGEQISIPSESLLEFRLAQPASIQVAR